MAFKSIENINSLNSKVQAAKSDKIVFKYGIKLIIKILTEFKTIIEKIKKKGHLSKKEAIRLYKIIDIRLDEIIQEIKGYCKKNCIDLDRYFYISNEKIKLIIEEITNKGVLKEKERRRLEKFIKNKDFHGMKAYCLDNNINIDKLFVDNPEKIKNLNVNYFNEKIFAISCVLKFILKQGLEHICLAKKIFDVEVNYSLGNYVEKRLDAEYLNKSFWEMMSYAKLQYRKNKKISIPLFSETHLNYFKTLQNDSNLNQRRRNEIRRTLDSFLDKGEDHHSFIFKYIEIIPKFNLFDFKELKEELSLYEIEIEKIENTMKTEVWYDLDILIWIHRAYYGDVWFIENNIEETDLMSIYDSMFSRLSKRYQQNDDNGQFILKNRIGFDAEEFKSVLDSVVMSINDYENEEGLLDDSDKPKAKIHYDSIKAELYIGEYIIKISKKRYMHKVLPIICKFINEEDFLEWAWDQIYEKDQGYAPEKNKKYQNKLYGAFRYLNYECFKQTNGVIKKFIETGKKSYKLVYK